MPPLTVTCPNRDCRASLKLAAPPPAGMQVRRPRCNTAFAPPAEAAADDPLALAPEPEKSCPSCQAPMTPEAVLCVLCGFNLKTGQKLEAAKTSPKRKKRPDRQGPLTRDDLPELLEEADKLIGLGRKELWRLPHILGLGDDPNLAALKRHERTGRCANPSCKLNLAGGLLSPGRRAGTGVLKFTALGRTVLLDLCEDCTQIVLDDLALRDETARGYLSEARKDLESAGRQFPDHGGVKAALQEVRKVELLAKAERPRRRACFVATAAFGSPLAAEVETLRRYRDEVLERSAIGRCLTRIYCLLSPPLAALIAPRPRCRALARRLLRPVIAWCSRRLNPGKR